MAKHFDLWVKNNAAGEPELFLGKDPDAPPPPPSRPQFRGSNLTGGGTPYTKWATTGGPVKGTHYQFVSAAEVDKLIAAGAKAFRIVFAWEAMQPTEYAVLDTLSGNYKIYRDALYACVAMVRSKGLPVLLDIHGEVDASFAGYKGVVVGKTTPSGQKVEDLLENIWYQLATKYKADPGVMFGVTNEPHDIPASTWYLAAQKVIDGIRRAANVSKIVMPGVDWTGAGSWAKNNATAWNLVDPANNLAAQVHLYFDPNSGGGTSDIVNEDIGVTRLKDVCAWGRAKNIEIWIAEVALDAKNPIAQKTWEKTLAFINANKDVFGGFLWWATGPAAWWGGYPFALIGPQGQEMEELTLLKSTGSFTS